MDELATARTDKTCRRHQPGDALATDANAFGRKIDMNARRSVGAARSLMRGADLCDQRGVCLSTLRRLPLRSRVIAAGGDTQQPAHGGDREGGLILAHEPEPFDGIVFVSRANQAAAFERISLSSLS